MAALLIDEPSFLMNGRSPIGKSEILCRNIQLQAGAVVSERMNSQQE